MRGRDQGQQVLMPQTVGFVPQLDHSYGLMSAPPNFAISAQTFSVAGQTVAPITIFPFPGTYTYAVSPSYPQQQQRPQVTDIGALTDRMGDMRFREGRDHHYGHHHGSEDHYQADPYRNYEHHRSHEQGPPQHQREFQQMARGDQRARANGNGNNGNGHNGGGMNGRQNGRGGGQQPQQHRRPQKGMEEKIKRTVYISSIDLKVTEAELASFFSDCGRVVDCRICGDPNLAMRFAFIEFQAVEGVQKALAKTGVLLMDLPLRVLPSKTAILPVSKELMPRSQEDVERCSRTVYVANIDKKVNKEDVRGFFEELCGKVSRLRLLGDYAHPTRIAFVEFVLAEGAMAALHCSGALLGSLPLRVSPSKTPVRPDTGSADEQGANRQSRQQQAAGAEQASGGGAGDAAGSAADDTVEQQAAVQEEVEQA